MIWVVFAAGVVWGGALMWWYRDYRDALARHQEDGTMPEPHPPARSTLR